MPTTPKSPQAVNNAQSALLNPEHSIQVRGARVHNLNKLN